MADDRVTGTAPCAAEPEWIGMSPSLRARAAPLLRGCFSIDRPVKSARLSICGLGYHETLINGRRVGDHVLDPAQTDYQKRCLFVTHETGHLLHKGTNVMGVMLGDGFFNQDLVPAAWGWHGKESSYGEPRLWAKLDVELENGDKISFSTNAGWKCATGPVTSSNIYAGESYDARLEKEGWTLPEFDAGDWSPVEVMAPPGGTLEEQVMPPVKKIEEIRPVAVARDPAGALVVDMGQNFSGWARIRVKAPAGTVIRLRFSETVFPDGRIDPASTGVFATSFVQTDTYVCKGAGVEIWEPRFTYHGFRYVEVSGWPGRPGDGDITGIVVHTALQQAGSFECSDERLNLLHRMALWTHRSNIHGIPEDCPARERCGWLGDALVVCEYSLYNFQSLSFWEKFLDDIETTRSLRGGLPAMVAPGKRCDEWTATPDWMAAFIHIPWYLHVYRGERRVLERHWDGMCTVIEHFGAGAKDWILTGGLGDWCDPTTSCGPTYTPEAVTTTMWFFSCAGIMRQAASVLGHTAAAARYGEWEQRIRDAFVARFFDPAACTFGSQTADAMALHFGLVPDGKAKDVVASMDRNIREKHHLHHTIGIMGSRYLFEALSRNGRGDTALALMHQDTYPGFGDLIRRGATTLWEYWGEPEVDKADGPRSLNHPMMGGFDNWFYNCLAGIRPDEAAPGFAHFFLEPHPVEGLDRVRAHYDSPAGRIASEWRYTGPGRIELTAVVPERSTATAVLPLSRRTMRLGPGTHRLRDECPAS